MCRLTLPLAKILSIERNYWGTEAFRFTLQEIDKGKTIITESGVQIRGH